MFRGKDVTVKADGVDGSGDPMEGFHKTDVLDTFLVTTSSTPTVRASSGTTG